MLRDIIGKRRAVPGSGSTSHYSQPVEPQALYSPLAEAHPQTTQSYEPETECNILTSDVEINGTLSFTNDLIFDGQLEGEIISGGCLTLGENALVKGVIQTQELVVYGRVEGDISVKGRCHLRNTSTVYGNITGSLLSMEPGASFFGEIAVGDFETIAHTAPAEMETLVPHVAKEAAPMMELVEAPAAEPEPALMETTSTEEEEESPDFLLDSPAEEAPKRTAVKLTDVLAEIQPLSKAA